MLFPKSNKLLIRFLTGNIIGGEGTQVSAKLRHSSTNTKYFQQLQAIWLKAAPNIPGKDQFDTDAAWNLLNRRIGNYVPEYHGTRKEKVRRLNPTLSWIAKIAAVLLIAFGASQLLRPANKLLMKGSGGTTAAPVILADGSIIQLNKYSSIKYPEKFGKTNRDVYFWGEAFFDIAADKTKPFVIEVGETRIKVVGTSFNVKANSRNGGIEVVVNSGKVLFYTAKSKSAIGTQVMLEPGDKGVYTKATSSIAKSRNDNPNFLTWKTGILTFKESQLPDVLNALNQKFGVNFVVHDNELNKLKLTAKFDNESLDSILDVLKLVFNIEIKNNGKDYLILKK